MARYRRINIDGVHQSETKIASVELLPGTIAVITDKKFEVSADGKGQLYAVAAGYNQGLGVDEKIPAGETAHGEYVSPNRELAVRASAGTYKKDDALIVSSGTVTAGDTDVVAYSQEDVTLEAGELLRIRIK